jgi:hypothetical protein
MKGKVSGSEGKSTGMMSRKTINAKRINDRISSSMSMAVLLRRRRQGDDVLKVVCGPKAEANLQLLHFPRVGQ